MPDRDYTLNYLVNGGAGLAMLNAIANALLLVEANAKVLTVEQNQLNVALGKTAAEAALATAELMKLSAAGTAAANATARMGGEIDGLIPKMLIWQAAITMVSGFADAINQARENLKELGKEAAEVRDRMRELANLKGREGPDDVLVAETVIMGMEAALKPTEATQFLEQFEGSIPIGREKKNIAPELERGLAVAGMKFGNRVSLSPATAGDITGVMAQYGKIDSVEQAMGKMGAIAHGLNEGRGQLEPLMRSLLKVSGAIVEEHGGPVSTIEEAAALLGVTSLNSNPDRAGTQLRRAVTLTRRHSPEIDRHRKTLGMTDTMQFFPLMEKLVPGILKADREGIGGDQYLKSLGYKETEEIRGAVQIARNWEAVKVRLDAAQKKGQGAAVMEADENFMNNERAGIHRKIEARAEGAKWLAGQKVEPLNDARSAGSIAMREQNAMGGMWNAIRRQIVDIGGLGPQWLGTKTAMQQEQEIAFMRGFSAEAGRVGVDLSGEFAKRFPDEQFPADRGGGMALALMFDKQGGTFLRDMMTKVQLAGGDPFAGGTVTTNRIKGVRNRGREDEATQVMRLMKAQGQAAAQVGDVFPEDPDARRWGMDVSATWMENTASDLKKAGVDPFGGSKSIEAKFDRLIEEQRKTREAFEKKAPPREADGARPSGAARY